MQHLAMQGSAAKVSQRDGHFASARVDFDLSEELKPFGRCEILFARGRRLLIDHLNTEGVVGRGWAEGARMHRPGNKLPEWEKIVELRFSRIVIVRRGVVNVRREPDYVAHAVAFDRP